MSDVVTLTQNLIRCQSVTPEDAGAQKVLIDALKPAGFEIIDLPFEDNGSYPVKNFLARYGTKGPHLCYNGHTDVVPAGDEAAWSHPPFEAVIKDGKMYGRGTSDMKAANCAFAVAALRFIKETPDFNGSISLLITGDEEADAINGTVRCLEWMMQDGQTPDVALVGESASLENFGDEVKIGRRGSLKSEITVFGKQGHVAYPQLADNPVPKMARLITALEECPFDEGTKHFPPTNLEVTSVDVGNKATNVIPAKAQAKFNIRYNDLWTPETLDKKLREILDATGIAYELKTSGDAHVFVTKPGEWTDLVCSVITEHTGFTPKMSTGGGTSDARHFAGYCPVIEFGLTNETIHQVDEHLRVAELEALVDIYTDILRRYFQ